MLLNTRPSDSRFDSTYPVCREAIPDTSLEQGRYLVSFAKSPQELERIQRLRYQVFNLELGEGLESSRETGLDVDDFDAVCHHLQVIDRTSGELVGTYRLQTNEMADQHRGYYSAGEFQLTALPPAVQASCVELGRACIALAHRNRQVLFLLWRGLAAYVVWNRKRFFFGCSSLTSQDPMDGHRMLAFLTARGHAHEGVLVPPLPGFECVLEEGTTLPEAGPDDVEVPSLFRTYLRYGAKICGPPAIDREFKTIDFLMLFDLEGLDERRYQLFFG